MLVCVLLLAACGGERTEHALVAGSDPGLTRQFDEVPPLVAIDGPAVIEAGTETTVFVLADATDYRGPHFLSEDDAQGVELSLAGSAATLDSPRARLLPPAAGRWPGLADDVLVAPVRVRADADLGAQRRLSLGARNSRSRVERELVLVPAGSLYLRALTLSAPMLVAGQAGHARVELSAPAPAPGVEIEIDPASPMLEAPARVHVAAGQRSAEFTLRALDTAPGADLGQVQARLIARFDGIEQSATLWLRSAEPFLLRLAVPRRLPEDATTPAVLHLSAAAAWPGQEVRLDSNNSLVTLPETVTVPAGATSAGFDIRVGVIGDLSAVRIGARSGAVRRVADALVGRRAQTPRLLGFEVTGPGPNPSFTDSACFDTERGLDSRTGSMRFQLDRPAPPGGFVIHLGSSSAELPITRSVSVPAGSSDLLEALVVPFGAAAERARFVTLSARAAEGPEQFTQTVRIGTRAALDAAREDYVPHLTLYDSSLAGGATLEGRVVLGRVDGQGRVEAQPHPNDRIPVELTLTFEDDARGADAQTQTVVVEPGLGAQEFAFALPLRRSATRARLSAWLPVHGGLVSRRCDIRYETTFALRPGGLLRDVQVTRHVFGGELLHVRAWLAEPAPAGGAEVALNFALASVRIAQGSSVGEAFVPTPVVSEVVEHTLRATYVDSIERSVTLMPRPSVLGASFIPAALAPGERSSLRLTLDRAYPAPMVLRLQADAALGLPTRVVIPPGRVSTELSLHAPSTAQPVVFGASAAIELPGPAVTTRAELTVTPNLAWAAVGSTIDAGQRDPQPRLGRWLDERLALAYIASAAGDAGRLVVKWFDGTNWQDSGGPLNPTSITSASDPALARYGASPIVAWSQGDGVQQNIFTARWTGSAWEPLGAAAQPLNASPGTRALAPRWVEADDRIGLAWIEDAQVQFAFFDGQHWTHAAAPRVPGAEASMLRVAWDPATRRVLLAWLNAGGASEPLLRVAALDLAGGPWQFLPTPSLPPRTPGNPYLRQLELATMPGGPTLVASQGSAPLGLHAWRWSGGVWQSMGARADGGEAGELGPLALLGTASEPLLAYAIRGGVQGTRIVTRRFDGLAWAAATPADPALDSLPSIDLGTLDPAASILALVQSSRAAPEANWQLRVRRFP